MSQRNRPFFKGLPNFTSPNNEMEVAEARKSIYFWWWQFARLSPVLWYANQKGLCPIDPAIAKVKEGFGDIWTLPFGAWWKRKGSKLFAESKRPERVTVLDLLSLHEHPFSAEKMYVEVPLNIRQKTIISQFKKALADIHEGRGLNLAEHSNANFKLHTKRYRLPTIEREYWVLLYKLLHPNIEIWRIGDRLQIAPQHRVRDITGGIQTQARNSLNSVTGRYYYKARFTLLNLERDSFPNYESIDISTRIQPFGAKHQVAFREATENTGKNERSAWAQWLQDEYAQDLYNEVISMVPHLAYNIRRPESNARNRIDAFIVGSSDLLE